MPLSAYSASQPMKVCGFRVMILEFYHPSRKYDSGKSIRNSRESPAYIGVGPVFATPTKEIPDPVLGCAEAGRIIRSVGVPAVAIGGIDAETLPAVLAAGAVNFAVVRAVCDAARPLDAIRRLQDIWRAARDA